jgi:hypothetical protein
MAGSSLLTKSASRAQKIAYAASSLCKSSKRKERLDKIAEGIGVAKVIFKTVSSLGI